MPINVALLLSPMITLQMRNNFFMRLSVDQKNTHRRMKAPQKTDDDEFFEFIELHVRGELILEYFGNEAGKMSRIDGSQITFFISILKF